MRRREFFNLVGSAVLAWPIAADAQQPSKVRRVGLIFTSAKPYEMAGQDPINPAVRMFVHTLQELGYVEGSNLALERRSAEGKYERFSEIVRELVSLNAHVIVTITNPMTRAAKEVTRTTPIVMGVSADPVGDGLVQSLGRPGGNITGLSLDTGHDIVAKRIQLLKEIVPTMSRLIFLQSKAEPLPEMEQVARSASQLFGVKLLVAEPAPLTMPMPSRSSSVKSRMLSWSLKALAIIRTVPSLWSSRRGIGCQRCMPVGKTLLLAGWRPTVLISSISSVGQQVMWTGF
jgi:putative tryptophan/tyrosine transport system substrate-binding protein